MTFHDGRLEQLNWTEQRPAPRRRRWPTRLGIALLVLAGLFTAADRIAVSVVQDKVAERIQATQNLAAKPSVTIANFPFLTQLIGMRLDKVSVGARNVQRNGVRITDLRADLYGVKPTSGFQSATADRLDGSAFFSWADLQSVAAAHNIDITLAEGADQTIRVTGTLRGRYAGFSIDQQVTLVSKLTIDPGNRITVKAVRVESKIPGLADVIPTDFDFQVPVGALPMGMRLVSDPANSPIGADGIRISATAVNVTLTSSGINA